jgi:hypothetical protein
MSNFVIGQKAPCADYAQRRCVRVSGGTAKLET